MLRPYKRENLILELLGLFRVHPGFLVSLAYILLTMEGVFYSWTFYEGFDVPILQIADFSDFLISGIREPISLILLFGGIAVGLGLDALYRFTYDVQVRWRSEPASFKRSFLLMVCYTPRTLLAVAFTIVISFVLYTWMFVTIYADWKSDQIRSGFGNEIYMYTGSENGKPAPVLLIGSTLNYIITYDQKADQAAIVPIENVKRILPIPQPSIIDD
ncbi:MAG: hypothetical protein ACI9GW_002201 [Halieaceae bacterium]|jgi:hypothetical protein